MRDNLEYKEVVRYIIRFLLGEGNEKWVDCVSYGEEEDNYVNIVPSAFFSPALFLKEESLPSIPLKQIQSTPLLFGEERIEKKDGKIVTRADIIASTFFLITRYEEYIRPAVRDQEGRFPGKESLPYRAGFIHRPIVEEYGALLRGWLRDAGLPVGEPVKGIRKVYLTHDVDAPMEGNDLVRRCLSAGKDLIIRRNPSAAWRKLMGAWNLARDPFWTAFDWLKKQDEGFLANVDQKTCEIIYFLICGSKSANDSAYSRNVQKTRMLIEKLGPYAQFGLHTSYYCGMHPQSIPEETGRFREILGYAPVKNRYHFLTCREPQDLRALRNAGITDDFTFAYADIAGFRLGTCRPVRWIDVENMCVTGLTLHPMTIMECTLDRNVYMGLSEEEAVSYARALIDQVYSHAGEVVLLWHNTSVARGFEGYQRRLYCQVQVYLKTLIHNGSN